MVLTMSILAYLRTPGLVKIRDCRSVLTSLISPTPGTSVLQTLRLLLLDSLTNGILMVVTAESLWESATCFSFESGDLTKAGSRGFLGPAFDSSKAITRSLIGPIGLIGPIRLLFSQIVSTEGVGHEIHLPGPPFVASFTWLTRQCCR